MTYTTLITSTLASSFTGDKPHDECLLELAKFLFNEGFIDVNIIPNKENGELIKRYTIVAQRNEDSNGNVLSNQIPKFKTEDKPEENESKEIEELPKYTKETIFSKIIGKFK